MRLSGYAVIVNFLAFRHRAPLCSWRAVIISGVTIIVEIISTIYNIKHIFFLFYLFKKKTSKSERSEFKL